MMTSTCRKHLAPAEPSVHEAFDEGVLDRLSRCDVVPFHLDLVRPLQDRVAGEVATIVADNHFRLATLLDDPIQLTDIK